eukprot:226807_1
MNLMPINTTTEEFKYHNPYCGSPISPSISATQPIYQNPYCGSPTISATQPIYFQQQTQYEYPNTLVLLDWDDTLFPTSMIMKVLDKTDANGFALVCNSDIELLHKLGLITLDLLIHFIKTYGSNNIHIVTNSLNGWINNSLSFATCISKTYQQIRTLLIDNNIKMVSAKSKYSKIEKCPIAWKRNCFQNILNDARICYKHIITIGDRWTDIHSSQQAIDSLKEYTPIHHMIKLKKNPNLLEMYNQITSVKTSFNQIFDVMFANAGPIVIIHDQADVEEFDVMIAQWKEKQNIN